MTDAIKAMELLEVAEKWLEPFGVTDPFSKLRLEGYLSLKPDYRYGALALLKVGGKEAPQRILATPKLRYPFDRTGAFHFPSVRQIDIYEKIDGKRRQGIFRKSCRVLSVLCGSLLDRLKSCR